jgi:hypothetical protein
LMHLVGYLYEERECVCVCVVVNKGKTD